MTTVDFIIDLLCRVDTEMHDVPTIRKPTCTRANW
jgi:hypothetical protein